MKRKFIIDWFATKSVMSKEEIEENLGINYFEKNLIDSFAFLELISTCETEFDIKFSDEDFADDDIFTIQGIINLLESKNNSEN